MANYVGGYVQLAQPLLKTGLNKHTAALEDPVSDKMLDAVNTIQKTKWRINRWVLGYMREVIDANMKIGDLPDFEAIISINDRIPEEQWLSLSTEERIAAKVERVARWDKEMSERGRRAGLLRMMQVAEEMVDDQYIWFPHGLDFRGRVYPMPQDLNPQGDQFCKALLEFGVGKPLGERGAYWLMIALANAAGEDKLLFPDRIKWVQENTEHIINSVEAPLDYTWWCRTKPDGSCALDDPWHFLALAHEYAGYVKEGPGFVSHQPIHIDATCSGMQHLSAMGLDAIGGRAVNLMNTGKREDLYQEVGNVVMRLVSEKAAAGDQFAHNWLAKLNHKSVRKVVKKAVMTTPYGVTPMGIRDGLIAEGFCKGLNGNPSKNAGWLKDLIIEALASTVVAAKQIMGWLQETAQALAEKGYAFCWTTPTGMKVRQAYIELDEKRVRTLYGDLVLREEGEGKMSTFRANLASAPNFVHSMDASHLALTVLACRDLGIKDIALIHDSYGTHACNVDLLGRLIRKEFVKMYSGDLLADLEAQIKQYAPEVELPERPKRGTLEIEGVLDSAYFFS